MGYKIIRPRHGIKSLWDTYKTRIYKQGEMLVESPESGVGSGPVNIKFGDGVSDYESLPFAVQAPSDSIVEGGTAPLSTGGAFSLGLGKRRFYEWTETDGNLSYKDVLQKNWSTIANKSSFMAYVSKAGNIGMFEGFKHDDLHGSVLFHGPYEDVRQIYVKNGTFTDIVEGINMFAAPTLGTPDNIATIESQYCKRVGNMIDFCVIVRFTDTGKLTRGYVLTVNDPYFSASATGIARGSNSGMQIPGVWYMANNHVYVTLSEESAAVTLSGQYFLY